MTNKKYKIKEVNYIRTFAYFFIIILFLLHSINTLIIIPKLIHNDFFHIDNYSNNFILKMILLGFIFGIMNIIILYKVSVSNPLEIIPNSARKKIKLSIYIINTLMFFAFTLLLTMFIFIEIEDLADLITETRQYFILEYILINAVIASITVNITLFSLSLPLKGKNK